MVMRKKYSKKMITPKTEKKKFENGLHAWLWEVFPVIEVGLLLLAIETLYKVVLQL